MLDFLLHLFDTSTFPARWYCGLWSSGLGWLHIGSDTAIFGAYAAIPGTLIYFTRKRRDIPFPPIFWLFAAFIFACGTGHLIEASIFWHPWYRLAGLSKLFTAVISWMTVIALIRILPKALELPGLSKANELLAQEMADRKETEARLQDANRDLTIALKEREVLLQEVHHRVKNNLQVISSLISMQARKMAPGGNRDAFQECQTRVQTIALIHEALYRSKNYSRVAFADYARTLAKNIFAVVGVSADQITLDLAIDDVAVGVDRAIPCGLLLNELVTNALKHGFKQGERGVVRVELAAESHGMLRLTIKDTGVGLPPNFDIEHSESLGLQLVRTLAGQLDAELRVGNDPGAMFQLRFAAEA